MADELGPFEITEPLSGEVNVGFTIFWDESDCAFLYQVNIATDPGFTNIVQSNSVAGATCYQTDPLPEGDYYIGVTAENESGDMLGAGNNGLLITVVDCNVTPGAFSITGPSGDISSFLSQSISWTNSQCASSYDVTIATDAALTNIVQSSTVSGAVVYQATPLPAGDYFVDVIARSDSGETLDANNGPVAFSVVNTAVDAQQTIFVTSQELGISTSSSFPPPLGSINSVEGGCWQCTLAAFTGGLLKQWDGVELIWTAVLSDSTTDARDHVPVSGRLFNTQGQLIANGEADLWDGSLANPIQFDEFGNAVTSQEVWSGSTSNGSYSGFACGNWNDNASNGQYGRADSAPGWIDAQFQSCANTARLYCVGPPTVDPAAFVAPDSLFVVTGSSVGGDIESLQNSDDNLLSLRPDVPAASTDAPIVIEFVGQSAYQSPSQFRFRLETSCNTANVDQMVEFFNFDTGEYELVDGGPTDVLGVTTDQQLDIPLDGDLARFVDNATSEVQVRISFMPVGPVLMYPWRVDIDQVAWFITGSIMPPLPIIGNGAGDRFLSLPGKRDFEPFKTTRELLSGKLLPAQRQLMINQWIREKRFAAAQRCDPGNYQTPTLSSNRAEMSRRSLAVPQTRKQAISVLDKN